MMNRKLRNTRHWIIVPATKIEKKSLRNGATSSAGSFLGSS